MMIIYTTYSCAIHQIRAKTRPWCMMMYGPLPEPHKSQYRGTKVKQTLSSKKRSCSCLSANCQPTFAGKKGLCDYVATNHVGTSSWKGVPLDSQASQQWGQWLVLFHVLLWLYHTWMGVQNKIAVETTTTTIIIDIARNGITYHITMKYHKYSHIKTIYIHIT